MKTVKLAVERNGKLFKYPTNIETRGDRLFFPDCEFALKDEIKSLQGSHWHGRDEEPEQIWSALDSDRNRFQLDYMQGLNPYEWWDRPVVSIDFERSLRDHQKRMVNHMMTFHYGILAAEMGLGKTLAAIEVIERSGLLNWWWVGPKSAVNAVEREFKKWGLMVPVKLMTYEGLVKLMQTWKSGDPAPKGVVFDESSRLKNSTTKRAQAAQALANVIRVEYGKQGYVVLMSGTPAPKSPLDWWSQCEIAWPGFVREGSIKAFKFRLGLYETKKKRDGFYHDRITWLDDERKCAECGGFDPDEIDPLEFEELPLLCKCPNHQNSINEVVFLEKRLQGLVLPMMKKDCVDLPDKQHREIRCKPTRSTMRVAEALIDLAPTAIQALTWLRELSDGFQYTDKQVGEKPCECTYPSEDWPAVRSPDPDCHICEGTGLVPIMERQARMVPTPKDQVVKDLLEECDEQGRIVIFAGFRGSIDRVQALCLNQGWDVVRVDGRGWRIFGENITKEYCRENSALDHWISSARRVVFLAHPKSGGLGLTLTESRMAVFYSNDFDPESRSQASDRIHRMGMDLNLGATIVDIFHLPVDEHVRNILRDNRKLELLTLGEVQDALAELEKSYV